ncbi:Hypothetical protein R9X50_00030000 [Acrodontium crateriforme]|uniref:WD40 repeat-like protein n=1 Tax=Acrodontium crateriforme TaxID=150365 RepID=A0AAQ3R4T6_9PEZI|nr:Hypothetical protein R9X50_00030000 [Acrodontium crateriforme]
MAALFSPASLPGGASSIASSQAPSSASTLAMNDAQQFQSPRRAGHPRRQSDELHQAGTPHQQQGEHPYTPTNQQGPTFNVQHATPQSQPSTIVPSNAHSVPGALQPAGGARPQPSAAYSATGQVPTMHQQPPQQQPYTQSSQPPSRSNTIHSQHSYSRSSPAVALDTSQQKYIPFHQSPSSQATPSGSNPKAYNLSHHTPQTPSSGAPPSHSPLNLTDIRSRAISDANDQGMMGMGTLFSYSDTPTNSNYLAPFATYAYDWCKWPIHGNGNSAGKMAVGSYLEDPHNFIQILDTHISPQDMATPGGGAQYGLEYTKIAEATCAYPVTRILWEPPSSQKQSTDLLATSGDHLRLWSLPQPAQVQLGGSSSINRSSTVNSRDPAPQKLQPLALLSNSKTPEHTAPLTSLDWNTLSPKLIITSSIDTTCTIWDIPTLTAKTQLIAHDKEVFDVRFCAGSVDVFVSCGADGSVRMFDLRSLEHSTIIYEPADKGDKEAPSPSSASPAKAQIPGAAPPPLLRLAASPHDAHLLATFAQDSNIIRILDVRQPGTALLELRGHGGNLNSIEWSPTRRGMLASGGDDCNVLVWDLLSAQAGATQVPHLANGNGQGGAAATAGISGSTIQSKRPVGSWGCEYEVANVSWAPQSALTAQGGEWLGVCAGRGVWGVKL